LFVFFAMANAGLPGTSGFVGEFMVILASFQAGFWYAAIAGLTLILGAAYSLWMIKRVVYGQVRNTQVDELRDINARERLLLGSLVGVVLFFGVYPAPLINVMAPSLEALLGIVMPAL